MELLFIQKEHVLYVLYRPHQPVYTLFQLKGRQKSRKEEPLQPLLPSPLDTFLNVAPFTVLGEEGDSACAELKVVRRALSSSTAEERLVGANQMPAIQIKRGLWLHCEPVFDWPRSLVALTMLRLQPK